MNGYQPMSVVGIDAQESMCDLALESPQGGCFVEVGVYQGGTARHLARIAQSRGVPLHLYDTFEGMPLASPQHGDIHKVGDFGDTSLESVQVYVPYGTFHPGVFPDTLGHIGPISFVHCDADQYQSIRDVIVHLWPQMIPNGVILFDDYGLLAGATKAVDEFFDPLPKTPQNKVYAVAGAHQLKKMVL